MGACRMRSSSSSEGKHLENLYAYAIWTTLLEKKEQIQDFLASDGNRPKTASNALFEWWEKKKKTIAYKHCITIVLDNVSKDAGFHATCYRRLTDKSAWFQWRNIKKLYNKCMLMHSKQSGTDRIHLCCKVRWWYCFCGKELWTLRLYIARGEMCHCVTVREGLLALNAVEDLASVH